MLSYYELSFQDPNTLTESEMRTWFELRKRVDAETQQWMDAGIDLYCARTDEWGPWYMEALENRLLVVTGELMLAGWKPEYQPEDHCYKWSWRRPPRRGSKGRLFHGTQQAYKAMLNETRTPKKEA